MRMSATSSIGFVPTSVAGRLFVVPLRVTVMVPPLTAAAITWLFVTTSPLLEMIMPVPWSSSPLPFTSMLTIEGKDALYQLGNTHAVGQHRGPGRRCSLR